MNLTKNYYIRWLLTFLILVCADIKYAWADISPLVEFSKIHVHPQVSSFVPRKIAFLPFHNFTDTEGAGKIVGDLLIKKLKNRGKYDLIDDRMISEAVEIMGSDPTTLTQYTVALELGKRLKVQGVIIGSVSEYGFKGNIEEGPPSVGFSARMINVTNGAIVWSFTVSNESSNDESLSDAASRIAGEIVGRLNMELMRKDDLSTFGIHLDGLVIFESLSMIKITWPESPFKAKKEYILYRGNSAKGSAKEIARFPAQGEDMKTSFIDENVLPGTIYYYRYSLTTSHGLETLKSDPAKKATTNNAPIAPGGVKAKGNMLKKIALSWYPNPEPEVEGYKIYRSKASDGPYRKIGAVDEDEFAYLDKKNLDNDVTYYYKITAHYKDKGKQESKKSEAAYADTKSTLSPPSDLTVRGRVKQKVLLSWALHPDPDTDGYVVYRGTSADSEYFRIKKIGDRETLSYTDENLGNGATYFYKISAYSKIGGVGDRSPHIEAATKAAPAVPKDLRVTNGLARKITLYWSSHPDPEIVKYNIVRADVEEGSFSSVAKVKSRKTNHINRGLPDNSTYYYKIQAIDKYGLASYFSETVSGSTKPLPRKLVGLVPSIKDKKVKLEWKANPEKDIAGYNIFKKGWLFASKIGNTPDTSFIDYNAKPGNEYEYYIVVYDQDGLESEKSDVVSIEVPEAE